MGRLYTNPDPRHRPHGMRAVVRWGVVDRLLGRRKIMPPGPGAPQVPPDLELIRRVGGPPRLTWIGHASFLVSTRAGHLLIDPVLSARAGWLYRRFSPAGLELDQLPPIDVLLVTHAHYDHLDATTVRRLERSTTVCVPEGLGQWFRRRGFDDVRELRWWDSTRPSDVEVTLVPARHWSRRGIADTNRALWGGFVIDCGDARLYHAGDSAWFGGFAEIGRRFPGLHVAMLPVGAYAPAWFMEQHHLNPEQAGRAFLELGARCMVPMHWGTFKLTDEPLNEPVERLRRWWATHRPDGQRELRVPAVGQTLVLGD